MIRRLLALIIGSLFKKVFYIKRFANFSSQIEVDIYRSLGVLPPQQHVVAV